MSDIVCYFGSMAPLFRTQFVCVAYAFLTLIPSTYAPQK